MKTIATQTKAQQADKAERFMESCDRSYWQGVLADYSKHWSGAELGSMLISAVDDENRQFVDGIDELVFLKAVRNFTK